MTRIRKNDHRQSRAKSADNSGMVVVPTARVHHFDYLAVHGIDAHAITIAYVPEVRRADEAPLHIVFPWLARRDLYDRREQLIIIAAILVAPSRLIHEILSKD